MKTDWPFNSIRTLLIALGLVAWGTASAWEAVYSARMNSQSTTSWDTPFWWISAGGSPYSTSTGQSTAPGTPPSRVGCYVHTLQAMSPGEGFGVVCTACSAQTNTVYEVFVTQPSGTIATDSLFGVCSTNCDIGGLSGGGGSPTNTIAFQSAQSLNKWGFVCWLTNSAGVPNPEIEFHYVSGTDPNNSLKQYADCIRFTQLGTSTEPTPVRITSLSGTVLQYSGGSGARFVLLKSANLRTALGSWQRADTNTATPSQFTIPAVSIGAPAFYTIASE